MEGGTSELSAKPSCVSFKAFCPTRVQALETYLEKHKVDGEHNQRDGRCYGEKQVHTHYAVSAVKQTTASVVMTSTFLHVTSEASVTADL